MAAAQIRKHYLTIVFVITLILLIGIAEHLMDFLYIAFFITSYVRFMLCKKQKRWYSSFFIGNKILESRLFYHQIQHNLGKLIIKDTIFHLGDY